MKQIIKCLVCGKELKSLTSLLKHISGHKLNKFSYFDLYFNKNEKCPYCNEIKEFRKFKTNEKNQIEVIYKSCKDKKCSIKKRETTNLKKFGSKNPFQSKEIKEKIKQTNLEKYGVENPSQSKEIRQKVEDTNLKKFGNKQFLGSKIGIEKRKEILKRNYGVEYPLQNKNFLEKQKQTNLKRYGVKYVIQSKEIKEKIKQTNLEKYGVENPTQIGTKLFNQRIKELYGVDNVMELKEIRDKVHKTNIEKYGYETPLLNKEIQEKIKQTNLKKYGVENPFQSDLIRDKIKQTNIEKYGTEYVLQSDIYKQTNLEKYGVEIPSQSDEIKEKIKQTNLEKYGVEIPTQLKEIQDKIKQTNLERYGTEFTFQSNIIRDKIKQVNLERYGVEFPTQLKEIQDKIKKTNLKKYGTEYVFQSDLIREKIKQTNLEKYGVEYVIQSKEIQDKIKQANLERYGVEFPTQLKEIQDKIHKTKKENGTYGKSKMEDDVFNYLKNFFPGGDIERQFKSEVYPFNCDYYISSLNLYIELQAFWSHFGKAFNPVRDKKELQELKEKGKKSDFYNNVINVWTQSDTLKRTIAKDKQLNFLEIFDYEDFENIIKQIDRVINGLRITYTNKELHREFNKIKNSTGTYEQMAIYNKIVKTYQQHFFDKENELYKTNPIVRRKLIENRIKYLNKKEHELTDSDLLRGFKISGIYQGFSFFNPLWIKKFVEDYKIKTLYDMFGGWGHRLLGCLGINYIYNDFDERTYKNVKRIANDFVIENSVFYNEDSTKFKPTEDFDGVCVSPPYLNVENYKQDKTFKDLEDYKQFIEKSIKQIENKNYKYLMLVISDDYFDLWNSVLIETKHTIIEEHFINKNKTHLNKTTKKNLEKIYIYKKTM